MARLNRVFPVKRGDTKPLLSVALLDSAGAAVDLSLGDPTVKLLLRCLAVGRSLSRSMTIPSPATAGLVRYQFVAGDWAEEQLEPGQWLAEIQVTYADGTRQTAPANGFIHMPISDDLGD